MEKYHNQSINQSINLARFSRYFNSANVKGHLGYLFRGQIIDINNKSNFNLLLPDFHILIDTKIATMSQNIFSLSYNRPSQLNDI